jgi:hypothetical protein
MPLTYQAASLQMEWCLQCHRQPELFIRPKSEVFKMEWPPAEYNQAEEGKTVCCQDDENPSNAEDSRFATRGIEHRLSDPLK